MHWRWRADDARSDINAAVHAVSKQAGKNKKAVYKYVKSQEVQQMCSMGETHHTVSLDVLFFCCFLFFL